MNKTSLLPVALLWLVASAACACSTENRDNSEMSAYVPVAPDYGSETLWYKEENDKTGTGADVFYVVSTWEHDWDTADGKVCHYADVWSEKHRNRMKIEISKVAKYMADGNNFYSPYYRHTTIEAWATQNEDTIRNRTRLSMNDVKEAFDLFVSKRDNSRPLIIAGFSQGGLAVVELLKHINDETAKQLVAAYVLGYKVTPQDTAECKHIRAAKDSTDTGVTICYNTVKDVKYVNPLVSVPCAMCINPVNWRTDSVAATLNDTITVTVSPSYHVLVVKGYEGSEYHSIMNILNIGDIHSCEPWLYSECLRRNIKLRTQMWRNK